MYIYIPHCETLNEKRKKSTAFQKPSLLREFAPFAHGSLAVSKEIFKNCCNGNYVPKVEPHLRHLTMGRVKR